VENVPPVDDRAAAADRSHPSTASRSRAKLSADVGRICNTIAPPANLADTSAA
jgi:hypothetical protein